MISALTVFWDLGEGLICTGTLHWSCLALLICQGFEETWGPDSMKQVWRLKSEGRGGAQLQKCLPCCQGIVWPRLEEIDVEGAALPFGDGVSVFRHPLSDFTVSVVEGRVISELQASILLLGIVLLQNPDRHRRKAE